MILENKEYSESKSTIATDSGRDAKLSAEMPAGRGLYYGALCVGDPLMWFAALFFVGTLMIWLALDNTWPFWDGASHVLDAIIYRDLFRHPHILDSGWWHNLLTVNFCYAPHMHAFYGFLKIFLGPGLLVENICLVAYSLILSFSIFNIALLSLKDRMAALSSLVIINALPLVMTLTHMKYLDFGYLAFFSLAMLALLVFQNQSGWRNAIFLGLSLGLAVSSKQVASYFLLGPCLALLIGALREKNRDKILQIVFAGAIATSFLAIWIIPNYDALKQFTKMMSGFYGNPDMLQTFMRNGPSYFKSMGNTLSIGFYALFVISLVFGMRSYVPRLGLFVLSVLGVLLFSLTSCGSAEPRYIVPVCVFVALLCGAFTSRGLSSRHLAFRVAGASVLALAIVQYLTFSFTPYPISKPGWLAMIPEKLKIKHHYMHDYMPNRHPTPAGDIWGQEWTIDTIKDSKEGGWLCVIPNNPRYNVHTFRLISKLKKAPEILPTTMRSWTLQGDRAVFDENMLANYHWFLINPDQGRDIESYPTLVKGVPIDSQSKKAMDQFEEHLEKSESFELYARREVADGSSIKLYRKSSQ